MERQHVHLGSIDAAVVDLTVAAVTLMPTELASLQKENEPPAVLVAQRGKTILVCCRDCLSSRNIWSIEERAPAEGSSRHSKRFTARIAVIWRLGLSTATKSTSSTRLMFTSGLTPDDLRQQLSIVYVASCKNHIIT